MNIHEQIKCSKSVLLGALIFAFFTTSSTYAAYSMTLVNATLRAGFVPARSVLCVVDDGDGSFPIEGEEKLGLRSNSHIRLLRNLNDLTGCVKITNGMAALQFARLRTSPATWYLWPGEQVVEIADKQREALPNYGLMNFSGPKPPSGFLGILSHPAFTEGGFGLPSVQRTVQGFTITRWLLTSQHDVYIVQLVQEQIGANGSYVCRVLKHAPAPALTYTSWDIPTFE